MPAKKPMTDGPTPAWQQSTIILAAKQLACLATGKKEILTLEGIVGEVGASGWTSLDDGPALRAELARKHGCEILGFFEDLTDKATGKCLGTRAVEYHARPFGSDGSREILLTEPTAIQRGPKEVIIKASVNRPLRVTTMLWPICGRKIK